MENYYYRCEYCGYVHLVPAYWVSYNPEEEIEQEHFDLVHKAICKYTILKLVKE